VERKIRMSARLWMNSLDALVTAGGQSAVRQGAVRSEADIADRPCSDCCAITDVADACICCSGHPD